MSSTNNKNDNLTPLLGGIAGGAVSTIMLYPLDLIKVRLQVNEGPHQQQQQVTVTNTTTTKTTPSSTNPTTTKTTTPSSTNLTTTKHPTILKQKGKFTSTLRGVIRHEGLLGLYQGLTPALLASAASWGGYFFFYEGIKTKMIMMSLSEQQKNNNKKLSHVENFTAACASGIIMVFLTNPLWLIKTRMQLQMKRIQSSSSSTHTTTMIHNLGVMTKRPYVNLWDAGFTIVREEGVSALYKGVVPALLLVSHGGVQFVSYEYLKGRFGNKSRYSLPKVENGGEKKKKKKIGLLQRLEDSFGYLTMGAASKIIASTTTYPLQVIKSRLQQRSEMIELTEAGDLSVVHRQYKGLMDCMTKIWQKEGITGFFKGNIPNAIRVAPSAAITFVVYEGVMDMLC
uniref:Mitochondrial carrier protein n=1 Tax=Ditylum brightwellii TaxID=49249 RepID=A0A7S1ZHN0_9STRA